MIINKSIYYKKLKNKFLTNKKITPEFCYVLGVCYGDASIKKPNVVELEVRDLDFLLYFKKNIEKWSNIKCSSIKTYKKGIYRISFFSQDVRNFIKEFDIQKLRYSSKKNKCMFLKGIYDSEGSSSNSLVIMTTNRKLMNLCKILLKSLNIETTKIRIIDKRGERRKILNSKEFVIKTKGYEFSIHKKNSKILFRNNINFSIKRKRNNLNKLINNYKK